MTTEYKAVISKGSYTPVSILLAGDEPMKHSFDKLITVINVPKQNPPYSILIDLRKLQETITFKGFLEDESGESMYVKKHNLRMMLQDSGDFFIKWDQLDVDQTTGAGYVGYQGNLLKCDISEVPVTISDSTDNFAFAITIQFVVGITKG
jgi:hypothetical protein